jgi:hypothetical protein
LILAIERRFDVHLPGRMLEDATDATELDPKIIRAAVVLATANNATSL